MLSKILKRAPSLSKSALRAFSTAELYPQRDEHFSQHKMKLFESKMYEKDFVHAPIEEIDYVRSPLYDFAKAYEMDNSEADTLMEDLNLKLTMLDPSTELMMSTYHHPEVQNFTRYADKVAAPTEYERFVLQHPKYEKLRRNFTGSLFRFQKRQGHDDYLRKVKSYIADAFYPPTTLLDATLVDLFLNSEAWKEGAETEAFASWKEDLMAAIPRLNYDSLIQLTRYLSHDAQLNDKDIWRAVENGILDNLQFYDIQQKSQIMGSLGVLKPKHTSSRLDNILMSEAFEHIEKGAVSVEDIHFITQGFRQKKNLDLYLKIRQLLIDQKDQLLPKPKEGEDIKAWASNLTQLLYSVSSNRKLNYGSYQNYINEGINELIAHYEEDICEACEVLDADDLVRLAEALYLFKTDQYENIWWRVENRMHDLIEDGALESFHVGSLCRSFSKAQNNIMAGTDKLFVHLEPLVMKLLPKMNATDLSHTFYAYSIREVGNPELYKAFSARLHKMIGEGVMWSYQELFHLNYSLMFSDNTDQRIWQHVIDSTLEQDDILPMTYYKPFKYSWFYLKHNLPELKLEEYVDRFYYAERYFNASQFDTILVGHQEYHRMKCFLNQKVLVFPVVFQTFNNLMNMNFVFNEEKLIIQFHPTFKCRRSNEMPSALHKLPSKLMRYEGWEVLDLPEKEFNDWDRHAKVENLKGWLLEARARQAEKGVCPKEINAKPL